MKEIEILPNPKIGAAAGFSSVGLAVGLKRSGKPDLGMIVSDRPCTTAGMFTTNKVAAAPVVYDRAALRKKSTGIRAVVVNSGHANAATGEAGLRISKLSAVAAEKSLGLPAGTVLVCSTGIIGDLPPETHLLRGIDMAARRLSNKDTDFPKAILTTDKSEKIAGVRLRLPDGSNITMVGVAKGCGMIAPNMATMLAFIVTDAAVSPAFLKASLKTAVMETFNRVSVDRDTSTNDTALILAGGAAGNRPIRKGPAGKLFLEGLRRVCGHLAWKMVEDGEGATKVIEVIVSGARTVSSAVAAARTVAESLLVRTAMHGEDPNVGRVLGALGRSGLREIDPDKIDVYFNGVRAVKSGLLDRSSSQIALRNALRPKTVRIGIDLHAGRAEGRFLSCDLSAEYVRINAEYRT
ncbi:bifunctional glutamate N-acetyltransferase/amino-acid acetyltransferase ArgJ [bacterium]|nr:bifunctional glutamate N-acetyltransferase/amino-acid acetyltransferase ArgJ [bacterium]